MPQAALTGMQACLGAPVSRTAWLAAALVLPMMFTGTNLHSPHDDC